MSEAARSELLTLWELLARRSGGTLRSGKLPVNIGSRAICAAIDRAESRHVLVPLADAPDQELVWRSRAIAVARRNLSGEDGVVRTWLDIHCRRVELEAVFVHFAAAVIEAIRSSDLVSAEADCMAALDEWRALLGGGRVDDVSVIGLLGELLVLQRLARVDPIAAMECWEGPQGGRYDFRASRRAIEVKTTIRRDAYCVPIHGIGQLEIPEGGTLILAFVRLEPASGGALSIVGLVQRLIDSGVSEVRLRDAIASIGLDDLASDAARLSFEIREFRIYRVLPGFPRIVAGTFADGRVPDGVMDVGYTIDLVGQAHDDVEDGRSLFIGLFGDAR